MKFRWTPAAAAFPTKAGPLVAGMTGWVPAFPTKAGPLVAGMTLLWLLMAGTAVAASLEVRVAAANDDVLHVVGDDVYQTSVRIGNAAGSLYNTGLRFLNITIPQGSDIDSAVITLVSIDVYTAVTCNVIIEGEDVDDAATFSTVANYTGRARTTATVTWNSVPTWPTSDVEYKTIDFAAVVQEIIDRAGWASGNDLVIFINNNSSSTDAKRQAYNYETTAGFAALIRIVYSAAAGGTTPKGLRRKIIQMGSIEPQMMEWGQWEGVQ